LNRKAEQHGLHNLPGISRHLPRRPQKSPIVRSERSRLKRHRQQHRAYPIQLAHQPQAHEHHGLRGRQLFLLLLAERDDNATVRPRPAHRQPRVLHQIRSNFQGESGPSRGCGGQERQERDHYQRDRHSQRSESTSCRLIIFFKALFCI
jgi:hypothetical protein